MLELEETLHLLNPSGGPSNVNRFLRTEFIIQKFGNANFALPVCCCVPTDFSEPHDYKNVVIVHLH